MTAVLRPEDGAAQFSREGWAETRNVGIISGQCRKPLGRLNPFGGKEFGLGVGLPVVLQGDNQNRAEAQPADGSGESNGPAGQAHDPRRIGTQTQLLRNVFFVNERSKLTRFQRLNLTHLLWCKAPRRAALI